MHATWGFLTRHGAEGSAVNYSHDVCNDTACQVELQLFCAISPPLEFGLKDVLWAVKLPESS